MVTKKVRTVGLVAVVLIAVMAALVLLKTKYAPSGEIAVNVPAGWYLHHTKSGGIIFTRQENLPDIGATEGFAYGEQITMAELVLDKSMEEWIASRFPENDPLYTLKERGTLSGHPTLRVEHEAGASGKVLDYYLFSGDRAYVFSLYPLESYDAASKITVRNTTNVLVLEQIVSDYATKL
ncbi:MAG: hypothetical protein QY323_01425 [Patescibacteria group bacterium]|nr:MAG: hypothetical protein QY323_01425 [Patescibacteria group bacterium]